MQKSRNKKRNGVRAICSVITRFLQPKKVICDKYPTAGHTPRTDNLTVIRKVTKNVSQCDQDCIVFRHTDFINEELHAVARYCKVITEGPCIELFTEYTVSSEEVEDNGPVVDEGLDAMEVVPRLTGDVTEDITRLRLEGFKVDNDNEPTVENIPDPKQNNQQNNYNTDEI